MNQFLDATMDEDNFIKDLDDAKFQKDIRDVKRSLIVNSSHQSTTIYVVAICDDNDRNHTLFVPCSGTPLTHDVYDAVRDGFVTYAVDYCCLCSVPVSYKIEFEDSDFESDIPLPMSVVKRYMDDEEKKEFATWKSKFDKNYRFKTLQMLESY